MRVGPPLTLNQPEGLYYAKTRNHFGLTRICHPALAGEPGTGNWLFEVCSYLRFKAYVSVA
jgi:hypothetical protein